MKVCALLYVLDSRDCKNKKENKFMYIFERNNKISSPSHLIVIYLIISSFGEARKKKTEEKKEKCYLSLQKEIAGLFTCCFVFCESALSLGSCARDWQ